MQKHVLIPLIISEKTGEPILFLEGEEKLRIFPSKEEAERAADKEMEENGRFRVLIAAPISSVTHHRIEAAEYIQYAFRNTYSKVKEKSL